MAPRPARAAAANAGPPPPPEQPPLAVVVSDCSGKMGGAVAEAVARRPGCVLVPEGFTGRAGGQTLEVGGVEVRAHCFSECDPAAVLARLKEEYPRLVCVDYTVPDVVETMNATYSAAGVPFVMGTTGGDRAKLVDVPAAAGTYAVVAPQMGKQLVAFQAGLEHMAKSFPGAFKGYTLEVIESHQASKVDTSGTAKAIVASFQQLGCDFDVEQIQMVRDPQESVAFGVPEEHILGHAYHTYRLRSPDGTVTLEYQHNVCGREIYAEGTVDACLFLDRQVRAGAEQKVYTMIDVLEGGGMA